MKTKIYGAYTVLITPFTTEGQLDEEGLRCNIRFQIENKIQGLVALGTTGEDPTLTAVEKDRIMKITYEEIQGRCHYMVGTGSYSTQKTIENTQAAKKAGADSALVITPYYNRPTQEGLFQHYYELAKAVDLPIIIYNNPVRTGVNIETQTLKRLAVLDNIVGLKDASGNVSQMMDAIENILPVRQDFSIMSGDDILTYPLLALGGHGIYTAIGNIMPSQMRKLCETAFEGDFFTARKLHYQLLPYMRSIFLETNPIPIKTAMNIIGLPAGPCRLPLSEISKNNFEKLKTLYSNIKLNNLCLSNK